MNRPTLDSTPLGTNMNNGTPIGMKTKNRTTSPIESILVRTKMPEPTPLTIPTDFTEQNVKLHVPGDPDPDPP